MGYEGEPLILPSVPTEVYEDPHDAHAALGRVGEELAAAGLEHVIPFNIIYWELTGRIIYALDHEEEGITFDDPDAVRRTIGIFADQYFSQLRFHARGRPDLVDVPWQWLFYSEEAKKSPEGIQFLAGMSAHIIYDLPWALDISKVDDGYEEDYRKVIGMLIAITADKLATDYIPGPPSMRGVLKNAVLLMIAQWREAAWRDGKDLQEAAKLPTVREYGDEVNRIKREITDISEAAEMVILKLGRHAMTAMSDPGQAVGAFLTRVSRYINSQGTDTKEGDKVP